MYCLFSSSQSDEEKGNIEKDEKQWRKLQKRRKAKRKDENEINKRKMVFQVLPSSYENI